MRTRLLLSTMAATVLAVGGVVPATAGPGPGNGRITFGRYDPALDAPTLWVADADGRDAQQLFAGPSWFSDWSPKGTRIVYDFADETGVHIATIAPTHKNRRQLTSETGVQEAPDWSKDGEWITYDAMDTELPYFSTSIWVMRANGSNARRVTSGGFDVEPVFSPDGRQIAFNRIVDEGDEQRPQRNSLLVVNVDGSHERTVVPARAGLEHPDWSPDGKWLGFNIAPEVSARDSGAILAVRPNGNALHVLRAPTRNLRFFKVAWAPDGKQLLMGCFDLTVFMDRLCTSTSDGGHVRPVKLPKDTGVNYPAWGPERRS